MARAVRCKTEAPRPTNVRAATMYQASNVEHLLRAIMGIRAHPRLTSGKTSLGQHGTQSHGCAGQTVRPSLHSISQAGHRTRPFGLATALRSASRLVRGQPSLRHRKRLGQEEGISRVLPEYRYETSGVRGIDSASRPHHPFVLACPPCTLHHRRYATTDSQGARSRPQRPMPLWLWQEVQALPWSTEIVALTCGTQNCLRPPSSLLKRPRQACCATPAQDQKCWNAAAFEQSQFFDHTGARIALQCF